VDSARNRWARVKTSVPRGHIWTISYLIERVIVVWINVEGVNNDKRELKESCANS
jgi:hypothetical protein